MTNLGPNPPGALARAQHYTPLVALLVPVACYALPLYRLALFAVSSQLYSYVILVPLVSAYLVWIRRHELAPQPIPNRRLSLGLAAAGLAVEGSLEVWQSRGGHLAGVDALAMSTLSFVLVTWGVCCWVLDARTRGTLRFPLGFLVLMVPFPEFAKDGMEYVLQYASATAALGLFRVFDTPVFYHDLVFQLPDITLRVAPECSGIHSSVALLITSILAGYLFLKSGWKRSLLALAVFPLAVVRNGFRIFTIGELCVNVGPEMIDSPIHHRGGPLFFALSLIPLVLLLHFLIKSERASGTPTTSSHES